MSNAVSIKSLPHSEIEIEAEIEATIFDGYRAKALASLGKDAELPGFRKGHVPESILAERLGEDAILHEMAEHAIADYYPRLILEKKIEAIGRPSIIITKMAAGNPLGFKITTAVVPAIELPDYKALAKEIMARAEPPVEITEQEIDDTLASIKKSRNFEGELNDEFARTLGDFKTLGELRANIKENVIAEKKQIAREKKRIEIMDKILEQTKLEPPRILIDNEKNKMMLQFKDNIRALGLEPQNYFKQAKKTEEEIKHEWAQEATKRVRMQFVLSKIAELEHITVPAKELSQEVAHLIEHYKGADPDRARSYVEEIMRNDLTWKFLEGQR